MTAITFETLPPNATVNIARHLHDMAGRFGDKPAVIAAKPDGAYTSISFRQLDEDSNRYAHGLRRVGVTRGMRTILMVRPGPDFFVLTFALFKIGAVPILIDPGMGRRQLVDCLATVGAEAFIGIPLAHVGRKLYKEAFRSVRIAVTVGRRWFWGGYKLGDLCEVKDCVFPIAETRADELAAILFTSGSTGPAKGVEYEHGMFDAQVRYLNNVYGFSPEEVDLATFPLFALFDAALGMTAVIPDMDASRPAQADPRKIVKAIEDCGVTHMFGSPALLDRLSRHGVRNGVTLPTIKRVLTAGAPVPAEVLKRLRLLLSESADIFTPYGATEALPIASIESRVILAETAARTADGEGICVGEPLPGISVGIIALNNQPIDDWDESRCLPRGEIGEICVKGPPVTKAYFRNEEATRLAKIPDGAGLWHRMGDAGYLDKHNRLWFCGRKGHVVNTDRRRLFTVCCEAIFNRHPRVFRTALVGVGSRKAQRPVLCVQLEPEDKGGGANQLIEELLEIARTHEMTRQIQTVLIHPDFPVDVRHNAKIFREKLAAWAEEQV